MTPDQFTSFEEKKPEDKKWLIVTNNIRAVNAYGEMSNVWLTTFWGRGCRGCDGIVTFDKADRKIINLTHWKYA